MLYLVAGLLITLQTLECANLETQCFDTDPLQYCAELDTSTTITSIINEMNYFDEHYQFLPYGMIYNISIINSSDDRTMSSLYILGSHTSTSTSQIQWDISTFFMTLFLNITDNKNIFVDTEHDGLNFGLRIYDYVMAHDATKYLYYINEIYDAASSPIQDVKGFLDMVNEQALHHKFTMAAYFGMTLRNTMSSEIQETIKQYIELFNYTDYRYHLWLNSLESAETQWDLWVHQQITNRDKLYKQQYQTLFQKYFDLMDSLLTYAYWYQDSNLYDTVFRWKQKSHFIFQRWLFRASCVEIERDNWWIDALSNSIMNECVLQDNEDKCDNIIIAEVYHIERIIQKLDDRVNDVLNTNKIKFDVHRVKVDWLNHVDEVRDAPAIESAVKETVRAFVEDLELFTSWQSKI
eukprot:6590_1